MLGSFQDDRIKYSPKISFLGSGNRWHFAQMRTRTATSRCSMSATAPLTCGWIRAMVVQTTIGMATTVSSSSAVTILISLPIFGGESFGYGVTSFPTSYLYDSGQARMTTRCRGNDWDITPPSPPLIKGKLGGVGYNVCMNPVRNKTVKLC